MTSAGGPVVRWLVALVLAVASCSGCDRASDPAAGEPEVPPYVGCGLATHSDMCRQVSVPVRGRVRYALVDPLKRGPGSPVTLVDLGGPGRALFGRQDSRPQLEQIAKTMGTRIIALEEPWVLRDYPRGCRTALSDWFTRVHAGRKAPVEHLVAACDLQGSRRLWGWDRASYSASVDEVLRAEVAELAGFVGVSYGIHRLSYLDRSPGRAWLLYPEYPVLDGADRMRERVRLVGGECAGCVRSYVGRSDVAVRSVPVTALDVGAALVAAGYQAHPNRAIRFVRSGNASGDLIGRMSDLVTRRFGTHDLSPATLAWWQENCRNQNLARQRPARGPVGDFLWQWHQPCSQIDSAGSWRGSWRSVTCVVQDRGDRVVGYRDPKLWKRIFPDASVRTIDRGTHGLIDAEVLRQCAGTAEPD